MTLFIADSNDRIRQCLASLAACVEGIELVGEAGGVREAIGGIKRAKPDSVIVSLQMSGGSGLDVLSAARSTNPAAAIIVLTVDHRREWKLKCFALGANYFFEKSGDIKKIVTTLVLLTHQSSCQGFGVERRGAWDSVDVVQTPPVQSGSLPPNAPAMGQRRDASRASKNNAFVVACNVYRTSSRMVLSHIAAMTARPPPSGNSPTIVHSEHQVLVFCAERRQGHNPTSNTSPYSTVSSFECPTTVDLHERSLSLQLIPGSSSFRRVYASMIKRTFTFLARVSIENHRAIMLVLKEIVPKGSIRRTDEGFLVRATMRGESARELNRTLLSTLRRAERRTRLRSEWKSADTITRFFDYVPKGSEKV